MRSTSLASALDGFRYETARHARLDQFSDGAPIDAIDDPCDVLIIRNSNLIFQQKIVGRSIAMVASRSLDQSAEIFDGLLPALKAAIRVSEPGTVTVIGSVER